MAETFSKAFAAARKAKGPGKTFTWQGKSYSTNTKEDAAKETKAPPAAPRSPRPKANPTNAPGGARPEGPAAGMPKAPRSEAMKKGLSDLSAATTMAKKPKANPKVAAVIEKSKKPKANPRAAKAGRGSKPSTGV
jgi:hypothetical protein